MRLLATGLIATLLALAVFAAPGATTDTAQALPHCGTEALPVPDAIPGVYDFGEACEAHDICYDEGGTEADRSACDSAFLAAMNASCDEDFAGQFLRRIACKTVAQTFFVAVRLGGWLGFNYT